MYPRTTIVAANPLRPDYANGVLARSLFDQWPRDRLSEVYFPVGAAVLPAFDVCGDSRMIATAGRVRRFTADEQASSPVVQATTSKNSNNLALRLLSKVRSQPKLIRTLRVGQEAWYGNSWIAKVLERQLRELRPDIVYAMLGNYGLMKATYLACQRLSIPIYAHVTDDFVTSLYNEMPFASTLQSASERWFMKTINYASGLAAIGSAMAAEYESRYGRPWNHFTTAIDQQTYRPEPRQPDGIVRLVFAGNLGLNRWQALKKLAQKLRQLQSVSGSRCVLDIYSSPAQIEAYRDELQSPVIAIQGWAAGEELPSIFHKADILVHAESFDPATIQYTKLSVSTKISQYLMAGRCVLAMGPSELASIQEITKSGGGASVGDLACEASQQLLQRIVTDASYRNECGKRGRQYAIQWFDKLDVQKRFLVDLKQSCRTTDSHKSVDAA